MENITDLNDNERMVSISKTELAELPIATFKGKIVVIDKPEEVDSAVAELNKESEIGFDTETKPSFKRGQSNLVSLLQLSTHDTCYLFRLNRIGAPDSLKALMENPDILKIGVSIHDDFHNLRKLGELEPGGFIDLQSYVKKYYILDNSLARIYGILFGERISKGQRLTNWEAPTLTPHQQSYAALDAYACIKIYDYLNVFGFDAKSSPYYRLLSDIRPPQPQAQTQTESQVQPQPETESQSAKQTCK